MSTHGCLLPLFPLCYTRLLRPDVGAQEPDATVDDDYYYSVGAYYYVQPADDEHTTRNMSTYDLLLVILEELVIDL